MKGKALASLYSLYYEVRETLNESAGLAVLRVTMKLLTASTVYFKRRKRVKRYKVNMLMDIQSRDRVTYTYNMDIRRLLGLLGAELCLTQKKKAVILRFKVEKSFKTELKITPTEFMIRLN